jgi:hypothetical protein
VDIFLLFIYLWSFFPVLVYFSRFGMLYEEKSGNPGELSLLFGNCIFGGEVSKKINNTFYWQQLLLLNDEKM